MEDSVSMDDFEDRFLRSILPTKFEHSISRYVPVGAARPTETSFTLCYYPATATTVDGTVHPRMVFMKRDQAELVFFVRRIFEVEGKEYRVSRKVWDPPGIDPSSIRSVDPLPNRLPAEIVSKILRVQETSMNGLAFVLSFKDGGKASYWGPTAGIGEPDFLTLPSGFDVNEIVSIDFMRGPPPPGLSKIELVDYGTIRGCYY
jgi:hypothetical protein